MITKKRSKAETRELLMRALAFTRKQAMAKRGKFTLREVARQADVSHTLISIEHPEIAALVKQTKDELLNPGKKAPAKTSIKAKL